MTMWDTHWLSEMFVAENIFLKMLLPRTINVTVVTEDGCSNRKRQRDLDKDRKTKRQREKSLLKFGIFSFVKTALEESRSDNIQNI